MNELTAIGILTVARQGKSVLVVSSNQQIARQAFDDIAEAAGSEVAVERRNGGERILYPTGGEVRFTSHRAQHERHADVMFIDWDVETTDHDFSWRMHQLHPDTRIIRA